MIWRFNLLHGITVKNNNSCVKIWSFLFLIVHVLFQVYLFSVFLTYIKTSWFSVYPVRGYYVFLLLFLIGYSFLWVHHHFIWQSEDFVIFPFVMLYVFYKYLVYSYLSSRKSSFLVVTKGNRASFFVHSCSSGGQQSHTKPPQGLLLLIFSNFFPSLFFISRLRS